MNDATNKQSADLNKKHSQKKNVGQRGGILANAANITIFGLAALLMVVSVSSSGVIAQALRNGEPAIVIDSPPEDKSTIPTAKDNRQDESAQKTDAPKPKDTVSDETIDKTKTFFSAITPIVDGTRDISDQLQIEIKKVVAGKNTYFVADIKATNYTQLKAAFAKGKYGKSYRAYTSKIATENKAIIAINGDYYGFRNDGVIIRNGVLYRDKPSGRRDLLVIDKNGDFSIINEKDAKPDQMIKDGVWQTLSFGPALVENKKVQDTSNSPLSNRVKEPRTAIGQIDTLHYIMVVVDGRHKGYSEGMSLPEIAKLMADLGCKTAYNLDGGGSSTMVFHDKVHNKVSGGGERSVSDIVYFNQTITK